MPLVFDDVMLPSYSDAELLDLITDAPKLKPDHVCYVRCLSSRALAISCDPD